MARLRRTLRFTTRLVVSVLAAVVLVFALLYGALKGGLLTSHLDQIVTLLAQKEGVFFVRAEGIEGAVPDGLRVRKVEVGDKEGVWLTIYDAEATWHPFDLFHALDDVKWRVSVDDVRAKKLVWTRLPRDNDEPDEEPFRWDRFIRIVVGHVLVEDLEMTGELLGGHTSRVRAEGSGILGEWDRGFVKLDVRHVDDVPGSATIDLRTHGSPLHLEGTIHAEEGAGGALAALARLDDAGAVKLDVRASGPMRDWHGDADVVAENIGRLSVAARLAYTAEGPFEARGSFDPVPAQREKWLVGEGAPMSVYAKGAWAPDVHVQIDRAELVADGRRLTANGKLDLATLGFVVSGHLEHETDGARVATTLVDVLRAQVEGRGVLGDQGHLEATLDLDEPSVGDVNGSDLRATFEARDPAGDEAPKFELVADAEGLRLGDVTLPLFGRAARLTGTGRIDLERGVLASENAQLEGDAIVVKGPVAFTDEWDSMKASLEATATSLQSLERVFGTSVSGNASGTIEIDGKRTWDQVKLAVDADAAGVWIGEQGWNALIGESVSLEAKLDGSVRGPARGELALKTVGIEGTAKGSVGANGKALDVDAKLVLDNLARLAEPTEARIAGRLEATATARGTLDAFDVEASVRGDRFSWEGVRFDSLVADGNAKGLPETWAGTVRAAGSYGDLDASVDADVSMPSNERLVVRKLSLRGPRTEGTANLDIDLTQRVATGDVRFASAELSVWRPMIGMAVGGQVQLDARLAAAGATQKASGSVKVARAEIPLDGESLTIESLDASAADLEIGPRPSGTARVRATRVRFDERTLAEANLSASGDGRVWSFDTKLDLRDDEQWKLDAAGTLAPGTPAYTLTLARADGDLGGTSLVLESPAVVRFETGGTSAPWSAGPLVLRVGTNGRLSGDAAFAKGRIHIDASVADLPLEVASLYEPALDLEGTANGRIRLDGATFQSLAGELTLRGEDVASKGLEREGLSNPADVEVDARFTGGRVKGTAALVGLSDTRFTLTVDAPLDTRAGGAPLVANLVWNGNVAEAFRLFPIVEDQVSGRVDANLRMTGTIAAPRVTGRAVLQDGSWTHELTGLMLDDILLELEGTGTTLEVRQLTATDGEKGRVTGAGRIRFGELPAFDLEVDIDAVDATLTRLDIITARADADINVRAYRSPEDKGDLEGVISGKVKVNEARIEIPQKFVSDVPEIEVTEVGAEVGEAIEAAHVARVLLDLDVEIDADNRIFVTGRGLESEWASDVHVRGTTHDPRVHGKITSVRGQLSLLGRRFDVDTATLQFDGEAANVPYLTMTARAEANEITAIADVTGPATRPVIELRSEPSLPRDEVLSRVLFGQSAANLTPMQSVQLARGVAELTGSPLGGGGGFVTDIGRTLGFDRLDIGGGSDSDGAAALTASKYLTDDVYLRVQGGLTPEASKLSLEWRVLKNVTIESDVSQDAQGEVGATWRWDY